MATRQRNRVLGHKSLTGRCMGDHHHAIALLKSINGPLLEVIKFEGKLEGWVLHQLIEIDHRYFVSDYPVFLFGLLTVDRDNLRNLFQRISLTLLRQRCQVEMRGFSL